MEIKPTMIGVGLRPSHYPHLEQNPKTSVDWFEAISENYMNTSGRPLAMLLKVRENYPFALHGVGLSVASHDGVSKAYLAKLKALVDKVQPTIVSDHFCWSSIGGIYSHDLLPFPFTQEALERVCQHVEQTQSALGRSIILENISYYLTSKVNDFSEAEFINEVCRRTGCGVLLDLNNIYVNSVNHGFDPYRFLEQIDLRNVRQLHLAGPSQEPGFLFDTHSTPVPDAVWSLYSAFTSLKQGVPVIIEWDDNIPSFATLEEEAAKARSRVLIAEVHP